ncbi:MAG: glycosyltransferase family 39 protein, partial [bacterium]
MSTEMKQDAKLRIILTAVLIAVILAAYGGVRRCGFIYDDTIFITQNPYVQQGLSSQSLKWALTAYHTGNWHPLTWVSHLVDYSMFGMDPTGHHIVNLILHLLNAVLLFWILTRMTGSVWPSFFVAAFFAVHPLRVESVAWVSERKDVLAGTFWMLAIAAYSRYVERPGIRRYLLVAAAFLLGLMCKPMMVTFPFVLFLLDYWPLNRLRPVRSTREAGRRSRSRPVRAPSLRVLVAEKVPLLVMAAAVIAVTLAAQRREGGLALMQTGELSLGIRLGNAAVSYATYLLKTVYPAGLAVFYPHPKQNLAAGDVILSLAFLAAFTALVIYAARRGARFALTGWLWYLGVLVPVIGVVQTGAYAMADRYSYLPSIGILIVVVWGAARLLEKRPAQKRAAGIAGLAVLVVMTFLTAHQVGYWRDGTTLYT